MKDQQKASREQKKEKKERAKQRQERLMKIKCEQNREREGGK